MQPKHAKHQTLSSNINPAQKLSLICYRTRVCMYCIGSSKSHSYTYEAQGDHNEGGVYRRSGAGPIAMQQAHQFWQPSPNPSTSANVCRVWKHKEENARVGKGLVEQAGSPVKCRLCWKSQIAPSEQTNWEEDRDRGDSLLPQPAVLGGGRPELPPEWRRESPPQGTTCRSTQRNCVWCLSGQCGTRRPHQCTVFRTCGRRREGSSGSSGWQDVPYCSQASGGLGAALGGDQSS